MAFGKAKFDIEASRQRMHTGKTASARRAKEPKESSGGGSNRLLIAVTGLCVLALGGTASALFVPNIGKAASGVFGETAAYFKSAPHIPYTGKMPAAVAFYSKGNTKGRVMNNKDRRKYWDKSCRSGSKSFMCQIHGELKAKKKSKGGKLKLPW